MSIRILVADDHGIVREGLRSLLGRQPEMEIIGEATDGRKALDLVRELMPAGASQITVDLCTKSIIGQCVHYSFAQEIIVRLIPQLKYTEANINELAEHVTRFSLAAIKNFELKN